MQVLDYLNRIVFMLHNYKVLGVIFFLFTSGCTDTMSSGRFSSAGTSPGDLGKNTTIKSKSAWDHVDSLESDAGLDPVFRCQMIRTSTKDLWVSVSDENRKLFDYRIGAGGVIADIRDATNSNHRLLFPQSNSGPDIDRVIQEVFWAYNLFPFPLPSTVPHGAPQTWYSVNMNQAGSETGSGVDPYRKPANWDDNGNFNRTVKVEVNEETCEVVIYSINEQHFLERWPQFPAGKKIRIPTQTTIGLRKNGVIRVRNRQLLAEFNTDANATQFFPVHGDYDAVEILAEGPQTHVRGHVNFASWIPFDKSLSLASTYLDNDRSGTGATGFTTKDVFFASDKLVNGFPVGHYSDESGSHSPSAQAPQTNGYTLFYDNKRQSGLGVVFGKNNPECIDGTGHVNCRAANGVSANIRPMSFGGSPTDIGHSGPATTPGLGTFGQGNPVLNLNLSLQNAPIGTMVEKSYDIYRFHGLNQQVVDSLNEEVPSLPTPKIITDIESASSELKSAYRNLSSVYSAFKNGTSVGAKTNHLVYVENLNNMNRSELVFEPVSSAPVTHCYQGVSPITQKNIIYKNVLAPGLGHHVSLTAHIHFPAGYNPDNSYPVVAMFHGGGWAQGSPTHYFPASFYIASRGAIAISFQYRINKVHGSNASESTADAVSAIRWIRKYSSELGIDTDRIVLMGDSAGGHLAITASMTEEISDERGTVDEDISTKVKSIYAYYPVLKQYGWAIGPPPPGAEPFELIKNKKLPKTVIFQGNADKYTPMQYANEFCSQVKSRPESNVCAVLPFQGQDHGFLAYSSMFQLGLTYLDMQLIADGVFNWGTAEFSYYLVLFAGYHCKHIDVYYNDTQGNYWNVWDPGYGYATWPYGVK